MKHTIIIALWFGCLLVYAQPATHIPKPTVMPPVNSLAAVRDTCANFWTLAPADSGMRKLLVLPAQNPVMWIETSIDGAAPAKFVRMFLTE